MIKPTLSEEPREWRKFSVAAMLALGLVGCLLQRQGFVPGRPVGIVIVCAAGIALVLIRPVWFRSFYRMGATFGFHMGQAMASVALALCFIGLVVPMGLVLRLLKKDLLRLRRDPSQSSYWIDSGKMSDLDRQF